MQPSIVTGSCFCGELQFEIDLPTLFCGHCHCSMCRRPHGASYVTWCGVKPSQFRFTAGQSNIVQYKSSERGMRHFCRICGSQLMCHSAEHDICAVALATLHGSIDRAPEGHFYYDSRADWTVVSDGLPKYGGETGMEPLTDP